jgi:predicted nuclease of predicted toxin-antitoxin system
VITLLADENLNRNIVRALVRRRPEIDLALAQEAGLTGSSDAILLEWAATHGRVVLSHDFRTLPWQAGKPWPP